MANHAAQVFVPGFIGADKPGLDSCSLSELSSSIGASSPRPTESSEQSAGEQLKLPIQKPGTKSWSDMWEEDEELQDIGEWVPGHSPSSQASLTPSRKDRRRKNDRRKMPASNLTPKSLETEFAQQQPLPSGPTQGRSSVTLADIGFDCNPKGVGAPRMPVPPVEPYTAPAGPGPIMAVGPSIMSTAPAERPRPAPVCLPAGALGVPVSGDASSRTPMAYASASPTATSGDASMRAVQFGHGTPMNNALQSPEVAFCADASARTPLGCHVPSWPADVASPCRTRHHLPVHGYAASPACSPNRGMMSPSCDPWSPVGGASPEANTIRALMGDSFNTGFASGQDLAARLQAAAPESYED
mmetsp:Transcript_89967/g.160128  ORF Transcript_89967/g.160128 Transcript_89967/m.160128 type:complete len:357 (-) Transcript_89967:162-1232(-)